MKHMKKCRECGRKLLNSSQYFYTSCSANSLENKCKECQGGSFEEPENSGYRRCNGCGELLELSAENFSGYKRSDRNGSYRFNTYCKKCDSKRVVKWYEKESTHTHVSFEPENRKKYYENYKNAHPERLKEKGIRYRSSENGKQVELEAKRRRRARIKDNINNLTDEQWSKCLEYFDNKCAYCGKEAKLETDHVIPVVDGGATSAGNIVPACSSCNSSKGVKSLGDWYPTKSFYSRQREEKIRVYLSLERE